MWSPCIYTTQDKELTGVLELTNFPFDKRDCLKESSRIHSSLNKYVSFPSGDLTDNSVNSGIG